MLLFAVLVVVLVGAVCCSTSYVQFCVGCCSLVFTLRAEAMSSRYELACEREPLPTTAQNIVMRLYPCTYRCKERFQLD